MTATPLFGQQWPASVKRLEIGALEAEDLETIVSKLAAAGVRGLPSTQQLFETTRAYPGHIEHVVRYLLPRLGAMNFVIDGVLDGGVNDALNLDSHGKALSFLLLDMPVQVPASLLPLLAGDEES